MRLSFNKRFMAAWLAVVVLIATGVAAAGRYGSTDSPAAKSSLPPETWPRCSQAVPADGSLSAAGRVTGLFLRTSILRWESPCYARLVAPPLMENITPSDLREGNLQVTPFVTKLRRLSWVGRGKGPRIEFAIEPLTTLAKNATKIPLRIYLRAPDAYGGAAIEFRLDLALLRNGWKVTYCQPEASMHAAPSGGAQ